MAFLIRSREPMSAHQISSNTRCPDRSTQMAQLLTSPEVGFPSTSRERAAHVVICLTLSLIFISLTNCGSGSRSESGFPNPRPLPVTLTVEPSPVTVAPGSTITFGASPSPPQGFSLVWSVTPTNAGTITNSGVFTASGNGGNCNVVASWLPANPLTGKTTSGSANVTVLQPAPPSTDMAQASGAIQTSESIENAAIAGERLGSVVSTGSGGNVQSRSGFPVPCTGSNCH